MNSIDYPKHSKQAHPDGSNRPADSAQKPDRGWRTARLIARALSANPRSQRLGTMGLVRLHQTRARAYARAILKDADLAEDAVQEAWLEGFRNLKTLREPTAFPYWFRRIVFKQCDRIRRRAGFRELPGELDEMEQAADHNRSARRKRADADPAKIIGDRMERREIRRRLLRAYRDLSRADRRLVRLRFIEERPYETIARELDITVDTIKNRIRILRRDLRPVIQTDANYALPAHFRALNSGQLAARLVRRDSTVAAAGLSRDPIDVLNIAPVPAYAAADAANTPNQSALDLRCRSIA